LIAIGGIMAVLSAHSVAQMDHRVGPTEAQQDVFSTVRATLSGAADRTLAAALEDRPWMRGQAGSPAVTSGAPTNTTEPVIRLRAAVDRVRQLRPVIEPILREDGVPTELSAIILVESGGIPTALSPKGARGIWQFMPDTARRYGLTVSGERDDRLDIARSTHAAAKYLRDLYQQFGDWQLAFAAYNAGEQAVDRGLGRFGQRDFLAIQRALPQETRNYVPAVLQAMATLGGSTEAVSTSRRDHGQRGGRVLYAASAGDDARAQ
jgi:soluble lytic murein transglycosylase-like protein